jgi:hypothetical protein
MCIVVGAAGIAAGGAAASGIIGSKASSKAAKAQTQAADATVAEQRRQFDQTRADQQPWMQAGQNALSQLQNPMANFSASSDYQFRRDEGQRDIQQTAAARGGLGSGNALKALAEYNSNLASGEFGNWWNRQAGIAGVGQSATNAVGQFGQQTAGNIGNALMAGGDARASGVLGQANSIAGSLNSGVNNYLAFSGGGYGGMQSDSAINGYKRVPGWYGGNTPADLANGNTYGAYR